MFSTILAIIAAVGVHTNAFVRDGVSYAQRGGLGTSAYVATNIDVDAQYESEKFASAVARVSPPVELPDKWALANVTNAQGGTVGASDVGALSSSTTHLSGDVPTTRKVNNKPLSSDITLNYQDVGARPSNWLPNINEIGGVKASYGDSLCQELYIPTLYGTVTFGKASSQLSTFVYANGKWIFPSWTNIYCGASAMATETIDDHIIELAGKPLKIWTEDGETYQDAEGGVYKRVGGVYYTNLNVPEDDRNLYQVPELENTWQTSMEIEDYKRNRISWANGVWSFYSWDDGQGGWHWINEATLPLDAQRVTCSSRYFERHELPVEWRKVAQVAYSNDLANLVPRTFTINGTPMTGTGITVQGMTDNALILTNGAVKTSAGNAVQPSAIGAASVAAMDETQAIVQTWEGFLDGSNVVFSITNYISNTYNLKAAKLRILEMRDGEYKEVYNSRDEILLHLADFETNKLIVATNAVMVGVDAKVASKAPLAWGRVSSMGTPVEEGMVIINEPQTMFAGGTDWHRVALGEGSVCVLKTAGAPTYTAGDEGVFKFQDDGGTNYFGFAKTDSYTIGCNTDGITVQQRIVTLQYDITGATPCIWYKEHINTDEPWEQLNLPDGSPVSGASHLVQWRPDAGSGTRYCDINCQEGSGFFKATVEMSGSAKFITNMPADFSAGILCTDGIHKVAVDWNNGNPRLVEVQ